MEQSVRHKAKEGLIKELEAKTDIHGQWGMPTWWGVPLNMFTKDQVIQIASMVFTDGFTLEYPDKVQKPGVKEE